jgi:hypothetical protein
MKKNLSAILFSLAIIIAAFFLANAYKAKINARGLISVTGLGEQSFSSDLIVWEGSFIQESMDIKEAYAQLEINKKAIESYLKKNGVNSSEIVFSAVETSENNQGKYTSDGKFMGTVFEGYILRQSLQITSKEIDKIEKVSRKITELLNDGIRFYSEPPRYYYTKLEDLKIELISKATQDARLRAETIAEMSKSEVERLNDAQMGVFQITGRNSEEEYSWGGAFNTSSREKIASITMKLTYKIK